MNCTHIICYLTLYFREFLITIKVYSICAEMLIICGKYADAIILYTRMISIAQAANYSIETKIYCYK